ncbi:hypothetical protein RQP46_004245 [Phenoliferia psychrophenolica]
MSDRGQPAPDGPDAFLLSTANSLNSDRNTSILDAGSRAISVQLDLDRWSIKCDDDGCGMSRDDLHQVGQERYSTSKHQPREGDAEAEAETFGFRREALASVAMVAVLEVQTRRDSLDEGETYSLVVKDGLRAFEGVARTKRTAGGTTVWARDIFYKWPVRRRPHATPTARLALIAAFRQSISTISLLHPHVSFTLIETNGDSNSTGPKRLVHVARSKEGVLGRWRQLWGRAGVEQAVEFEKRDEKGELGAKGFFSLTASHSKSTQFIFVNSRPISPSPLQKLINNLFLHSTFSRHASSHLVAPLPSPSKSSDKEQQPPPKAARKSPKKAVERYAIFVLNLEAPSGMVDVTLEPEKRMVEFQDEKTVFAFIKDVVKTFLRAHGFVSTPVERAPSLSPTKLSARPSTSTNGEPPLKKRRTPLADPVLEQSSAYDSVAADASPRPPRRQRPVPVLAAPEIRVFPHLDPQSPTLPDPTSTPLQQPPLDQSQPIRWTDPTTHQTFLIDPRTGNSWRPNEQCPSCDHQPESIEAGPRWSGMVDRTSLRTRERSGEEGMEEGTVVPDWMQKTLQEWDNPVFPSAAPFIPSLRTTLPSLVDPANPTNSRQSHLHSTSHHSNPNPTRAETATISAFFSAPGSSSLTEAPPTRFSRSSLQSATFIAQVDRKFLLVRLNPEDREGPGTLVMVDQHAADERVRVERFLKELVPEAGGKVEVWRFEEPVPVVVSRSEARVVGESREEFARWGIRFEVGVGKEEKGGEEDDYAQVYLKTVPLVVAERLKVEARLRQELVRSFVAQIVERGGTGGGAERDGREGRRSWASALRDAPPVLLDLVNSKACRGAIMFNDCLTDTQATTLLARLADTAFPFQCAHGRPSLVPIVNLPSSSRIETTQSNTDRASTPSAQRGVDWTLLKPCGP